MIYFAFFCFASIHFLLLLVVAFCRSHGGLLLSVFVLFDAFGAGAVLVTTIHSLF